MQFLQLQARATQIAKHREPLIAVIQVTRAAIPLLECPIFLQRENPRQRPSGFEVISQALKDRRAHCRLIGAEPGINRAALVGLLGK